jgi:Mn2+/Fe2+ NRAMP family transporter
VSSGGSSSKAENTASQAADTAEDAGQQAMNSKPFRVLLTVGLIAYGVVHILIGWIALQIAWSGQPEGEEASQQGALDELAGQPFGAVLLWLVVIGLLAMAVWQLVEAIWGHRDRPSGIKRIRKRLGSAGRTITYAAIAIAAATTVLGSKSQGNKAMLPHVDEFRPVHNLESLAGLIAAIDSHPILAGDRRLTNWQTELRKE